MRMNYSTLQRLLLLRSVRAQSFLLSPSCCCNYSTNFPSQKHEKNTTATRADSKTNHLESKQFKKKNSHHSSRVKDSQLSKFIYSDKNDPDKFGTLSNDWKIQQELDAMPVEEDDVVEKEYLFNKQGKTTLTINQYATLIKTFIKQRKIGHAIEVLETRMLKEDRMQPDNYIYNLLIGACGQVGYTRKAFQLFKQMRVRRLKVTGHTYTGLFNSCANSPFPQEGLEQAQHLREILVEKAVLMNQTIYHAMIKAFGRCGDLETAFMFVDQMSENKIPFSSETFSFLLQACITDKNAGFRHALLVWYKMRQKRIKPDLYSFNLLLRCCRDCGLGDEKSTQEVIEILLLSGQKNVKTPLIEELPKLDNQLMLMHSADAVPNLISHQPTMGNIVSVKEISLPEHRLMLMGGSKGVLEQMSLHNIEPDVKTFTQLLDQIPSNLLAEQELLDAIKKSGVSLDVDFCNMLIKKRCLRKDYESAKDVLKVIQEGNLRPDIVTFGVLAMTCQSLSASRQFLQDMERVGYRPNIEILGTLLKNACYRKDCNYISEMIKIFKKEEVKPNEKFLEHLDTFYLYASNALKNEKTSRFGDLKLDDFNRFCEYYQHWRQKLKPEDESHPWNQFKEIHFEPEDIEVLNYGKVKYTEQSKIK